MNLCEDSDCESELSSDEESSKDTKNANSSSLDWALIFASKSEINPHVAYIRILCLNPKVQSISTIFFGQWIMWKAFSGQRSYLIYIDVYILPIFQNKYKYNIKVNELEFVWYKYQYIIKIKANNI